MPRLLSGWGDAVDPDSHCFNLRVVRSLAYPQRRGNVPMMIDAGAHPLKHPCHPPRPYILKPRSQLLHDVKLFLAVHTEAKLP